MRELNVNEIEQVNGGRWWRWVWMAGEAAAGIDWGDASGDPDTNLAP